MANNPSQPQVALMPSSGHRQQGYTLIELMVALSLGLLISAAAIQLFITSQTTFSLQQGGADVQDSSIFGLELMARNIRMANYGGGRAVINDFTPLGGLVLTATGAAEVTTGAPTVNLQSVQLSNAAVPAALLTRGQGLSVGSAANHWSGISNVSTVGSNGGIAASAQLVIQYRAPQDMFDCEGQRAFGPRMGNKTGDTWGQLKDSTNALMDAQMIDGDVVVERYFLRRDTSVATGEVASRALVLACDAGRYSVNNQKDVQDGKIQIEGYGDAGQVLINRVDHFDIRLGVEEKDPTTGTVLYRYYTVKGYLDLKPAAVDGKAVARPRIVSLKIGTLARAQGKSGSSTLDPNQEYLMLGQKLKITTPDSGSGYLRKVYETTVALRNGRGE